MSGEWPQKGNLGINSALSSALAEVSPSLPGRVKAEETAKNIVK